MSELVLLFWDVAFVVTPVLLAWAAACAALFLILRSVDRRILDVEDDASVEWRSAPLLRHMTKACAVYYYASLPVFVLGVMFLGIVGTYLAAQAHDKALILGLVMTAGGIVSILLTLLRSTTSPPEGIRVDVARHPRLQRALATVADLTGEKIHDVYLSAHGDFAAITTGTPLEVLRGTARRQLVLGAAVLRRLDPDAFRALVITELAMFRSRPWGAGQLVALRRAFGLLARHLGAEHAWSWFSPATTFVDMYSGALRGASKHAAVAQRRSADALAANELGTVVLSTALRRRAEAALRHRWHVDASVAELVAKGAPCTNIYAYRSRQKLSKDVLNRWMQDELDAEDLGAVTLRERVVWLDARDDAPRTDVKSSARAWDLFEDPEYLERELTHVIRQQLAVDGVHLGV